MESFTEKMFDFQRRATQAVLQKMGATETTVDEQFENTLTNFKRLGEFLTHLEESTENSLSQMEKMCFSNNQLASSLCNFVMSELANEDEDDSEYSTGLLSKFFLKTSTNPQSSPDENNKEFLQRKLKFQDTVQRLYDGFGTMGHENMTATQDDVNHKVVRPIKRDQDYNKVTKQLLEKRKKLNLDYDSIKRSNDVEKTKLVKEEFDILSKKTASHLQNRSFIRCKLIVHSVITMVQQFCMFFESNAVLLDGLLTFIEPLLSTYQLNTEQLADIYTAKKPTTTATNNSSPSTSSPKQQPFNGGGSGNTIPTTPPPTYKEHVESHIPSQPQQHRQSPQPQHRNNMNGNHVNINDEFNQKVSFNERSPIDSNSSTGSSNYNNYSPPPQQPKEEKLFSVWDDDSTKHGSDNGGNTSVNTSTSSTSNGGSRNRDDDWMYNTGSNDKQPNLSRSDTTWEDPLVPEPSKPTYSSFNNTPQQPPYFNSKPQSQPQQQQQPFGRQQPPLHQQNHNQQAQQAYQPPPQQHHHQQYPQQSQQQPPQQQQQTKKSSGFENIFGDFDFASPSPQRNGQPQPQQQQQQQQSNNNSNSNGNGNNFNFNSNGQSQPQPSFSQHADSQQHERSMIEPMVSEKIKSWGEKNGRKNNLRVLLSTLHDVLWVESGWEKTTYGSLITPISVKKAYRKAIIVVHPDKVHNGTTEQKMIAQRIFECLRESFEIFKVDLEPSRS